MSTENQEILSSVLSHLVQCFGIPFTIELKGLPSDGLGHGFQCGVNRLEGGETVSVEDGVIDVGQITIEVLGDGEGLLELVKSHCGNILPQRMGKVNCFF